MVQTLAAVGELQRELTYDGLRAAEAKGSKGGRVTVRTGARAPGYGVRAPGDGRTGGSADGRQRPWRIRERTMRQVVSDGGWMPMRSAVARILRSVAVDG